MGECYSHFTLEDRCTIARLRKAGQSCRQIASALGCSASSISREIRRNTGYGAKAGYAPAHADDIAWSRRWRGARLDRNETLRAIVFDRLAHGWSPEQIAGRLKHDNAPVRISHESIYRFIHAQIRRTNSFAWRMLLPRGKSKRGYPAKSRNPMTTIKNRVSIHHRPASVMHRKRLGHWEADLLHPQKSGAAILVASERKSRFIMLAKLETKHARPVAQTLAQWLDPLPANRKRSVTQDNGTEFFLHHMLNDIGIQTYFCDPHKPWQKGTVENTNGSIRRFIPRGTDPASFSNHDLQTSHRSSTTRLENALASKPPQRYSYQTNMCCTSNVNPPPRFAGMTGRGRLSCAALDLLTARPYLPRDRCAVRAPLDKRPPTLLARPFRGFPHTLRNLKLPCI
jgi:IS30 family transposase